MSKDQYDILMIEDNPGDVTLLQEVFVETGTSCNFKHFAYGENALTYLDNINDANNLPDMILMDINLRGDDGLAILKILKNNPRYFCIPTIIISSSLAKTDIQKSYQNYANAYINKPLDLDVYIQRIRSLKEFWLTVANLPGEKQFIGK